MEESQRQQLHLNLSGLNKVILDLINLGGSLDSRVPRIKADLARFYARVLPRDKSYLPAAESLLKNNNHYENYLVTSMPGVVFHGETIMGGHRVFLEKCRFIELEREIEKGIPVRKVLEQPENPEKALAHYEELKGKGCVCLIAHVPLGDLSMVRASGRTHSIVGWIDFEEAPEERIKINPQVINNY